MTRSRGKGEGEVKLRNIKVKFGCLLSHVFKSFLESSKSTLSISANIDDQINQLDHKIPRCLTSCESLFHELSGILLLL